MQRFVFCAKRYLGAVFLSCLLLTFSTSAEVRIERLDIQQPRAFGYQIGDQLKRIIHLDLNMPYKLTRSSLPEAGTLTQWLEIKQPEIIEKVSDDTTHYTITLTYQIVNINAAIKNIVLPSHKILYQNSQAEKVESHTALVPAFRFGVATLTNTANKNIQPDRKPAVDPQSLTNLIVLGALLLFALTVLAYLKWGLPFASKHHPFANASHALKKLRKQTTTPNQHSEALQIIHHAFNETAGRTVFVEKLDNFFTEHKKFTTIKPAIEAYFMHSREYFFAGNKIDNNQAYSLAELIAFVEQCHDVERGLA